MASWCITLFCNMKFFTKAIKTIYDIREIGEWKDDIVLLVSGDIFNDKGCIQQLTNLNVIPYLLPDRRFEKNEIFWSTRYETSNTAYVMGRFFQFMNFYVFDTYFKKWDMCFYMDVGMKIFGNLNRFKTVCPKSGCLYGHSDRYPYDIRSLECQFDLGLDPEMAKKLSSNYDLSIDYFQATTFIYDTDIIENNTVERLFELMDTYLFTNRNDQGIFNLYFNCEKKLWKQIPLKDDIGFLYDFHERTPFIRTDYLMLKYPITELRLYNS